MRAGIEIGDDKPVIEGITTGEPSDVNDGFSVNASVCAAELGLIDTGMSMTEDDRIGEPSRSAVETGFPGIEPVCSDGASVDNVLISGSVVADGSSGASVAVSLPEAVTESEPTNGEPPDCDALGSVASGASMLLVLDKTKPVVPGISEMEGPNLGSSEIWGNESSV